MRVLIASITVLMIGCFIPLIKPAAQPSYTSSVKYVPLARLKNLDDDQFIDFPTPPYVFHVWASWCASCIDEFARNVFQNLRTKGVNVVGINYKDERSDAKKLMNQLQEKPFDVSLRDPDGIFATDLGLQGVPETYLIERKGVIHKVMDGPITDEQSKEIEQWFSQRS